MLGFRHEGAAGGTTPSFSRQLGAGAPKLSRRNHGPRRHKIGTEKRRARVQFEPYPASSAGFRLLAKRRITRRRRVRRGVCGSVVLRVDAIRGPRLRARAGYRECFVRESCLVSLGSTAETGAIRRIDPVSASLSAPYWCSLRALRLCVILPSHGNSTCPARPSRPPKDRADAFGRRSLEEGARGLAQSIAPRTADQARISRTTVPPSTILMGRPRAVMFSWSGSTSST